MKKLINLLTLAMLLGVNVLTPMSYATGDLSGNDDNLESMTPMDSSVEPQNDNSVSSWAIAKDPVSETSIVSQPAVEASPEPQNDDDDVKDSFSQSEGVNLSWNPGGWSDDFYVQESPQLMNSPLRWTSSSSQLDGFEYWYISIPDPEDPTKWFTIMDRNLWATITGALYDAPAESYGYYYKLWNNYGYSLGEDTRDTMLSQIDEYWRWLSGDNDDNNRWYPILNLEERQWPCPEWTHVPSAWEREALIKIRRAINSWNYEYNADGILLTWGYGWPSYTQPQYGYSLRSTVLEQSFDFLEDMQIPRAGELYQNQNMTWLNFWSRRSLKLVSWRMSLFMENSQLWVFFTSRWSRWWGYIPVRCFYDSYIPTEQFSIDFVSDWQKTSKTVLSGMKAHQPSKPFKRWYIFEWWYEESDFSGDEFDFNTPITEDTTLYAKWKEFEYWYISIPDPEDPTKWITILDRNLWATMTGAWPDAAAESYGYYYQWWNNYGFSDVPIKTWAKNPPNDHNLISLWNPVKDGPSTYYSPIIFTHFDYRECTYDGSRWTTVSDGSWWYVTNIDYTRPSCYVHLWWWWADDWTNNRWLDNLQDTLQDRIWPCPEWTHVPSIGERSLLLDFWLSKYNKDNGTSYENQNASTEFMYIYGLKWTWLWLEIAESLQIPFAGYLHAYEDFMLENIWKGAVMHLSSKTSSDEDFEFPGSAYFRVSSGRAVMNGSDSNAFSVRCVANEYIPIEVSLTFKDGDDEMTAQNIISGLTWSIPSNPEKKWYSFVWRYDEDGEEFDFSTPLTQDTVLYAKWEKKLSGGSSWGGGWMKKDNCPDGDFSPSYYDGECGEKPHGSAETNTWDEIPQPQQPEQTPVDPQPLPPTETSPWKGQTSSEWQNTELADMHKRAYENWLTIYKPWEDAKFNQPLTRQQMAKISSIFWTKFLNQKADDSEWKIIECSQYKDLSKSKWEMRWYVIQSCLMKNMWYAYDGVNLIKKFKPYDKMSVAQASVILSRMAWWTKYVISPKMWYQWHMQAVYDHGLIDDISDPQREVTRWEAFMMMYRLSKLMNESKN